ncbi:response regulator transcription factor [Parasutterella sp.]|jgi:FixJ family two-component response regulator|uniref:response regulator transcription factor n=2 Tax=Sutterellaceae TaxID=995019 RepID=UPI0039935609
MNSQYKEKAVIRIVDDDEGFGDAIRFMLKTDGWLVSYYSETGTFLKKDDLDVPGCIILDYQMPLVNGLEFQDILAHRGYRQPIIFLTAHADVDMAISAFRSGAADILKKPVSSEILLEAVERAVESDFAFRQKDFRIVRYQEFYDALTQREKQILNSVNAGLMNYQIAQRLGLSERTVETHRANAYKKVGVKDLQQLKEFLSHVDI